MLWAPTIPSVDIPRIGRYTVWNTLGQGGMASIFLARATGKGGFEKWVAIKRPHPHLLNRPAVVTMILNEARLVARFEHENLCPIIDVDEDDAGPYIVMPYLHGEPLAELLRHFARAGNRMPVELCAHIGAMVANGLHYAHEARADDGRLLKVIHRDISPQNVFITFQGSVKVLDFGIAKAIGFDANTAVGLLKGKYAYMAPEQARAEELDRRTDIFALGVVLWETLAGKRLFRRDTELATADAVINHRPPLLSEVARHVPEVLARIIERALQPDRKDRFQTAGEMAQKLRAFLQAQQTFVGSAELARFMADVFPARAAARDPLTSATQTDDALDVLLRFDEIEKPADETVRMEAISRAADSGKTPVSSEPPASSLEAAMEGLEQATVREMSNMRGYIDRGEAEDPVALPRSISSEQTIPPQAPLERGLAPAATLPDQRVLESAPTLQLGFPAAQIIEKNAEITAKKPVLVAPRKQSSRLSERRFAQGILGVALILLSIAIVLWAERCSY